MPLFEYECIKCRSNVDDSLKQIEKSSAKKVVSDLVIKYDNINHIGVLDLEKEKVVAEHGKRDRGAVDLDFYLNEGTLLVFLNLPKNYRFSELIYKEDDEKKVKCPFCGNKKVEKVVSSFAFTSDLSTDMPKPDLSNLPPSVRKNTFLGDYIEEKDRPKKNK
jgi:DNA-directed RNA polymerase subunit RPC12/RpoP